MILDSNIAATVLEKNDTLLTNNEDDFTGIENLRIVSMKSILS